MKNKNKIKDQSVDELKDLYQDLSKDIYQINNDLALNRKLEKPHVRKLKKRERARVLTAINQKGGSV